MMAVTAPLTTTMTVLSLILVAFDPVQPQPNHLRGPNDMYVFKDNDVNLTCYATSAVGYYIVWHAIDGNGTGTFVGRCFTCAKQEGCLIQYGMDDDYAASKEGDAYTLTIRKPQVPTSEPFGHFECGYQKVKNCDSNPAPLERFHLLQSAIVYVYDPPSCSSAVANLNDNSYQDFTCTWTPSFYDHTDKIVKANIMLRNANVQSVIKLPQGIVNRTILGSLQDPEETARSAMCTVVLSDTMTETCTFPGNEEATVLIDPLNAKIRAGKSQRFHCDVKPNSTIERSWKIFKESGTPEKITTSTRSMAGDVTFPTDSLEYLVLKPRTDDTQYFFECSVVTGSGSVVSAYASVQTLGEEHTPHNTITQPPSIKQSTPVQPPSKITPVKPSGEHSKDDNNMVGILIFTIVPIVLIIIFFAIGFAIVWKRTRKRSFKQPARIMEVNYSNMGSNDNMVANAANDEDGYKEEGEK